MTSFNISVIIGHNVVKHALRPENNFRLTGYGCLYLVPFQSANKQKGRF